MKGQKQQINNEERTITLNQESVQQDEGKVQGAFASLSRGLTDEDLSQKGVQRLLLSELDKYDTCKNKLDSLETEFHRIDKENAVLKERAGGNSKCEILYSGALTLGAALIGVAVSIESTQVKFCWIVGVIGAIFVVGAILVRIFCK